MDVLGLSGIRGGSASSRSSRRNPDWFEWDSKNKSPLSPLVPTRRHRPTSRLAHQTSPWLPTLQKLTSHADLAPGAGPVTVAPWGFSQVNPNTFSRIRLAVEQGARLTWTTGPCAPGHHSRTVSRTAWCRAGAAGTCVATAWRPVTSGTSCWGVSRNFPYAGPKAESTVAEDTKWNAGEGAHQAHPS